MRPVPALQASPRRALLCGSGAPGPLPAPCRTRFRAEESWRGRLGLVAQLAAHRVGGLLAIKAVHRKLAARDRHETFDSLCRMVDDLVAREKLVLIASPLVERRSHRRRGCAPAGKNLIVGNTARKPETDTRPRPEGRPPNRGLHKSRSSVVPSSVNPACDTISRSRPSIRLGAD